MILVGNGLDSSAFGYSSKSFLIACRSEFSNAILTAHPSSTGSAVRIGRPTVAPAGRPAVNFRQAESNPDLIGGQSLDGGASGRLVCCNSRSAVLARYRLASSKAK